MSICTTETAQPSDASYYLPSCDMQSIAETFRKPSRSPSHFAPLSHDRQADTNAIELFLRIQIRHRGKLMPAESVIEDICDVG
jgi:hypothetical protein